jgi:hypothetical protein
MRNHPVAGSNYKVHLYQETEHPDTFTLVAARGIAAGQRVGVAAGVIMTAYQHEKLVGSLEDRAHIYSYEMPVQDVQVRPPPCA